MFLTKIWFLPFVTYVFWKIFTIEGGQGNVDIFHYVFPIKDEAKLSHLWSRWLLTYLSLRHIRVILSKDGHNESSASAGVPPTHGSQVNDYHGSFTVHSQGFIFKGHCAFRNVVNSLCPNQRHGFKMWFWPRGSDGTGGINECILNIRIFFLWFLDF